MAVFSDPKTQKITVPLSCCTGCLHDTYIPICVYRYIYRYICINMYIYSYNDSYKELNRRAKPTRARPPLRCSARTLALHLASAHFEQRFGASG